MTPTVSVVMAAKNYAQFLPAAVDSVLAQTMPSWELIIVDDGSTDATPAAVLPYLVDSRIRCVRSDQLGQSRAKNLGAALSRGEFIAYLDADDVWLPTKLEKQLAILQAKPQVGVCFSRRMLIDERGQILPNRDRPPVRGQVLDKIFLQNFVCFSSVMLRREVFDRVGRFDPEWDLSIDYDLWLRVARHFEFDFVDEELVQYRTGHGNLSKKLADRVATAMSIMHRAVFRRGLQHQLPERTVAAGHASTCRTLGYVLREAEPLTAARWYAKAFAWNDARWQSFKGLMACLKVLLTGRRTPGSAENASANL
jgi:glycosyltransferase involved in cell wall biosynthesis